MNLECHITNSSDSGHFEMIIYLITLFLFPMPLILVSFIMNVLFLNQTKIADAFRVVCTETGSFSGERSCLPFYCASPTPAVHAIATTSTAISGEASIYSCNEGYTHGNTGKTEFSVKCGADGKFLDTAVCEAVQCGSPSFPNVTVLGAGNMHFGQSDTGFVTVCMSQVKVFITLCLHSPLLDLLGLCRAWRGDSLRRRAREAR